MPVSPSIATHKVVFLVVGGVGKEWSPWQVERFLHFLSGEEIVLCTGSQDISPPAKQTLFLSKVWKGQLCIAISSPIAGFP